MTRRRVRGWAPLAGDSFIAAATAVRHARRDLDAGVGTWHRGPIRRSVITVNGNRMLLLTTVATKPEGTLS